MVATVAPPILADEMEAEVRRVSVLAADIQGSTALVQSLDPEGAADLLGPPIQVMIEEVERFEGVASPRGDGIVGVFGAPSASEDHAVRACLAAIAILDRLSSESAHAVKVRIGIHSGEVVFRRGRVGKLLMQDIFGVTAHIAARLEQTAEPGTAYLSRAAYQLAHGFVHAVPHAPIQVKGIEEPVERMLLVGADQTANRWTVRAEMGLAGLAGRNAELAILTRALASRERVGAALVQVTGPAGIGKSRLIHEFLATDEVRLCQVVKFVGDPHRKYSAYHPVSTWLRALLDIRNSDAVRDARHKLGRMVAQLEGVSEDERQSLETMLRLGEHGQRDLSRLEEMRSVQAGGVIAAIILKISAGRPIVLTCEDIDFFDSSSRELLTSLAEALGQANVLVVTTSRARVRLPSIRASASRSLALSPLSDDEATRLLTSLNSEVLNYPALTATILRKAGGNPLFLEEVASLIARTGSGGRNEAQIPRLFGEEAGSGIPDRVEALIADRLARLPKQQRRLVQACAVIGLNVSLHLAAKLTGMAEADLYSRLAKLQSEQVLYETRKYPDPQFSFKHALTRDVAYNSILPSRRREYHEKIVEILESEGTKARDRHLDDLCVHTIQARAWTKAITYLQMAANLAVESSSYELAERYLNRALEISRTLPDDADTLKSRIEILLDLRSLVGANGKYLEVSGILDEADALARQLGNIELQSRIMAHRAHVLNTLGDLGMAVALAERSREIAQTRGDLPLLLSATFFLGQAHFNLGNITAAEEVFSQNARLFPEVPRPIPTGGLGTLSVLTHGTRALARALKGDFSTAAQDVKQAKEFATETNRPYDLSFAWFGDGFVKLQQRDGEAAANAFRESMALAEAREAADENSPPRSREGWLQERARVAVPRAQAGLGHALLVDGHLEAATRWLSQAREISREHNRYMVHIWAASGLAFAHFGAGQDELALRFAQEAVDMGLQFGFYGFHVQALRARGLIRASSPATAAAGVEDLVTALSAAARMEMRTQVAHCHASFVLARTSDMTFHVDEAQRLYEKLNMRAWWEHLLKAAKRGDRVYC